MGEVIYKKCPKCGATMERDDSLVLTSIPPKYRYICPNCGEMEADTYHPLLSPYDAVKQELTLEDLVKYREELDNWDWEKFRREAAKDAMTGMMANADFWHQVWSHNRVNGRCDYPSEIAHLAIACADELIKQLKEK